MTRVIPYLHIAQTVKYRFCVNIEITFKLFSFTRLCLQSTFWDAAVNVLNTVRVTMFY